MRQRGCSYTPKLHLLADYPWQEVVLEHLYAATCQLSILPSVCDPYDSSTTIPVAKLESMHTGTFHRCDGLLQSVLSGLCIHQGKQQDSRIYRSAQ